MKYRFLIAVVIALLGVALSACVDGSLRWATIGSGGGGGAAPATYKYYLYIGRASAAYSTGFSSDGSTGVLGSLGNFDPSASQNVTAIAATIDGKFLYSANSGDRRVYCSTISPTTGSVGAGTQQSAPLGTNALQLEVSPDGKFLYSTEGNGNLTWWVINQTDCTLSGTGSLAGSASNAGFAISRNSDVLIQVRSINGGNIKSYSINPTTGALALLNTYNTPDADGHAFWPVFSPVADYVYFVTNGASTSVYSYSYTSGGVLTLTDADDSGNSTAAIIDPLGRFLFVPDTAGILHTWPISGATLLVESTFATGLVSIYYGKTDLLGNNLYLQDVASSSINRFPYNGVGVVSAAAQTFGAIGSASSMTFVRSVQP